MSAAVSISASASPDSGTVDLWESPYSGGVGSEYTAVTDPALYGSYAPSTREAVALTGQEGFQTFCLQAAVLVDIGSLSHAPVTYNFTLGLDTGPSGNVTSSSLQGTQIRLFPHMPATPIGDLRTYATPYITVPLTEGVAWLYSQFAQGVLQNYDFANTGTSTTPGIDGSRVTDAEALQSAIWFLQGGQTEAGYVSGGAGNVYYDEAVAHFGSSDAAEASASLNTDFGSEVMSLTDANGAPAQNQLVYLGTPSAPDNISTFPLLGATAGALVVVARRKNSGTGPGTA